MDEENILHTGDGGSVAGGAGGDLFIITRLRRDAVCCVTRSTVFRPL